MDIYDTDDGILGIAVKCGFSLHGPFDLETESQSVEVKIESAMKLFDYRNNGYRLDLTVPNDKKAFEDLKRGIIVDIDPFTSLSH